MKEGKEIKEIGDLLIPEEWQESFEVRGLLKKEKEWSLVLEEKASRIPKELEGKEVIQKGFRNPIEIVDCPLVRKPLYIQIYRRKWQEKGGTKVYDNKYELHKPGMKATNRFGDFLKGLTRQERHEFFRAFPNLRYIKEEDFSMVSRCAQWIYRLWRTRKTS